MAYELTLDDVEKSKKQRALAESLYSQQQPPTQDARSHISNALMNLLSGLGSPYAPGLHAPALQQTPYSPDTGSMAFGAGNIAGDVAQYMPAAAGLGAARTALAEGPGIAGALAKSLGQGLPGLAGRVGANAAYGAVTNPDNPMSGAMEGTFGGLGAEALPAIAGGLRKLGQIGNPKDYTNAVIKHIYDVHQAAKQTSSDLYDSVLNSNVAKTEMEPSNFNSLEKENKDAFLVGSKRLAKKFEQNPTFENAHELQSQLGSEARDIKQSAKQNSNDRDRLKLLEESRDALQQDMRGHLLSTSPGLMNQYEMANDIYRDQVVPFKSTETLKNIVSGDQKKESPQILLNNIQRGMNKGLIKENHYLAGVRQALENKIDTAKLVPSMLTVAGGLLGAEHGAESGAMGAVAGRAIGSAGRELATNPRLIEALRRLGPIHDYSAQALIGGLIPQRGY